MPEDKNKNTLLDKEGPKKLEPDETVLGEAGGTTMPRLVSGLVYNPDSIIPKTYLEMEDDAQIKAVLTLIKAPLLKVNWSIACEDPDIAKFIRIALDPLWLSLIQEMANALNFGHQAFEKVWKKDGKSWVYEDFMDLYPASVTYRKGERGEFAGIEQYTLKGTAQIPVEKSFVFTNEKRWGNPYGRSKLRSAYMYWYVDKFTYDFENRYFERYAEPIIWGQAPSGKTQIGSTATTQKDNLAYLLDILKALRNSTAVVTPSDIDPITKAPKWMIHFLEAQRRGADYRSRHEYLDLMKARAIFAPELVFSAPYAGSSYALAREHATIFMSAEEAILQQVKNHIDKYILPQLILYNFGSRAPKAYWDYESIAPETKTLLRDLVVAMVAGDIIRPDPDWISKTIGIKLREEPSKEKERVIKSTIQEKLLKALQQKPPEEEGERAEEGPEEQARRVMETLQRQRAGKVATAITEGAATPSKSAAAYKRWATTPTGQRFRSPRGWERAFSKGLFDDLQNHHLFGSQRQYHFSEEENDWVRVSPRKMRRFRTTLLGLINKFLPE